MPPPSALRKWYARIVKAASNANDLTTISFSLDPRDTFDALRRRTWRRTDLHKAFLVCLLAFAFSIAELQIALKFLAISGICLVLAIPFTSQFFMPFLAIATWLIFFFSCRFIPATYRPPISVRVLPALENILYGANISNILAKHTNSVLDVLGWLPYGVIHFGAPLVCSIIMFFFAAPETVPVFAISFGYMNIIGVIVQILFPCSPPWYENLYGLAPAHYGMPGSPGGLARIDKLFGGGTYTATFTASPMVFGAFPSLHSGSATIEAMFMAYCFPKAKPFLYAYVLWIWWATMYLTHHYFVDLIGGSILAASVFYYAKRNYLPQKQVGKVLRWDYEYIIKGETSTSVQSKGEFSRVPAIDTDLEMGTDNDWTLGSSSSLSSGNTTPVTESSMGWASDSTRAARDDEIEEVLTHLPMSTTRDDSRSPKKSKFPRLKSKKEALA